MVVLVKARDIHLTFFALHKRLEAQSSIIEAKVTLLTCSVRLGTGEASQRTLTKSTGGWKLVSVLWGQHSVFEKLATHSDMYI